MAGVHAVCARTVNYRVWGYRCGDVDVGVVGWKGEGVGDGNVEGCRCGMEGGGVQVWGMEVWKGVGVEWKCGGVQVWR